MTEAAVKSRVLTTPEQFKRFMGSTVYVEIMEFLDSMVACASKDMEQAADSEGELDLRTFALRAKHFREMRSRLNTRIINTAKG